MSGHARIPLPEGDHLAALNRLHSQWSVLGYRVSGPQVYLDGVTGEVSALNPTDQVSVSVQSIRPATALALLLLTPCFAVPS
jgi:hypothetical protein